MHLWYKQSGNRLWLLNCRKMKRIWLKISVDGLLSKIAYAEANGFDFEAKTLKGLITMTKDEERGYKTMLDSCIALKKRREQGYPDK